MPDCYGQSHPVMERRILNLVMNDVPAFIGYCRMADFTPPSFNKRKGEAVGTKAEIIIRAGITGRQIIPG